MKLYGYNAVCPRFVEHQGYPVLILQPDTRRWPRRGIPEYLVGSPALEFEPTGAEDFDWAMARVEAYAMLVKRQTQEHIRIMGVLARAQMNARFHPVEEPVWLKDPSEWFLPEGSRVSDHCPECPSPFAGSHFGDCRIANGMKPARRCLCTDGGGQLESGCYSAKARSPSTPQSEGCDE